MDAIKLSKKDTLLLDEELFQENANCLRSYISKLREIISTGSYEADEAFLNLPTDRKLRDDIKKVADKFISTKLKYVFVIGIGGSSLGAMAVYEALFGKIGIYKKEGPKLIFLDTNNPTYVRGIVNLVEKEITSPEEFVVNVICKSGMTTESLVNFEIIYDVLLKKFSEQSILSKRIVMTIGDDTKLWEISNKLGFHIFVIPKKVGGRYSVFSQVGLFPLCLAGVNIDELEKGAEDMREKCILQNSEKNPALISSVSLYLHMLSGKNILNTFLFNAELESFGKWYCQLVSESVGKEFDREGKNVRKGITVLTSIGSTDLHSTAQLFLGGPDDKITFFVHSLKNSGISIPKDILLKDIAQDFEGRDVSQIMRAILGGVEITYGKRGLPYLDIELENISAYTMGALMQYKMMEVIFLAELLNLNAFDQPNVESYKIETRKILES